MGVITALGELLSPQYLLMMIAGTMGGIMIGAMPGLTSVMGVTLLLPFTYGMDPAAGISMLLAISFGAIYGGKCHVGLQRYLRHAGLGRHHPSAPNS
jgi:putative tricarboxylic transport membrane protein